ncbi:MAG: hypothetical protein IPL61_15915 [Myxococcales bacterium]|nr:hypothetical protein [Myxococcales bacterium]
MVVLDAEANLLGSGAHLALPGPLTSWATAADDATGIYLYGEHAGAAPVFQRITVASTGEVRAERFPQVTAGASSEPSEIAAVAADGDAWAIVRGHGGRGELVSSSGVTVDLGVPAAKVTQGALVELADGVIGVATTGAGPLVARYQLDGQPVAGPDDGPPLDRMWGEPSFTSDRELHVMRMRHPYRSFERSTYVDTVVAHAGAEPAAFVRWTGRGFLVLYTSWFEESWRMFAATMVCDG